MVGAPFPDPVTGAADLLGGPAGAPAGPLTAPPGQGRATTA